MPSSTTYSAWWSPIVRAGMLIARIPRWVAIFSWVARPGSPSDASVPAPPSQTRSSSQTSGTSGWPVFSRPARTAARSRYFRCALLTISRAAFSGMMPSSACAWARAASTSSQDWNRAASVNSARTPGSFTRREVGSSSMGRQPRHVEVVHARGIAADDPGLLVVRHAGQDLRQDLPRLGKRGFAVRIVRAPHHVVHADRVAQSDTDGVLLEAQHDVAAKEVARTHAVPESIDRLAVALAIRVVHGGEHVGRPRELELHDGQREAGVTLEDAREDHVAHGERRIERFRRPTARVPERLLAGAADLALASRGRVQAERHGERLGGGPERLVLGLVVTP